MTDEQLTEKESLSIIYKMIESAKMDISEGSIFYLIWGWVVILAAFSTYVLLATTDNMGISHLPWPIFSLIGFALTMREIRKRRRASEAQSYIVRILEYFWIGFSVTLALVLISAFTGKITILAAYPLSIILYGMGSFVSGAILKFKPLIVGGIACWSISMFTFLVSYPNQLLFLCLAVVLAWLIPGYLLKNKKAASYS